METDYVIETYELERKAYAVFSGIEGEDPFLVAIVFDERLAKAMITAKHPDPEEGALIHDGDYVPALLPETEIQAPNDYRIQTHAEWEKAFPLPGDNLPNDLTNDGDPNAVEDTTNL
jgi:hypothetical protein